MFMLYGEISFEIIQNYVASIKSMKYQPSENAFANTIKTKAYKSQFFLLIQNTH